MNRKAILRLATVGIVVLLTGAVAVETVERMVIEPRTVSSWSDLFHRYLEVREQYGPIVPPSVHCSDAAQRIESGDWSFLKQGWSFTFSGGCLYGDEKSKLNKLSLPLKLLIYEDIQRGDIVILSSADGERFTGEALFDAPELLISETEIVSRLNEEDSAVSLSAGEKDLWLFKELSPRRVIWEITLKPAADAWGDLFSREESSLSQLSGEEGGMRTMSVPAAYTNDLWLHVDRPSGIDITIYAPDGFTNRVEIYSCTNLVSGGWDVAVQNLLPIHTNPAVWTPSLTNTTGFFRVGNMDIDSDGDGLPDARERMVYQTDPDDADTDGDGMPDGWEVQYGLNPLLYADGDGDIDWDGRTNLEEYLAGTRPDDALPLSMGFENEESFSVGNLDGQFFWEASSGVQVQSNQCFSGSQAVELSLGQGSAIRELMIDAVVVTNEVMVFLSNCAGVPGAPPAGSTSAVGYDPLLGFMAYDGTANEWVSASGTAGPGNQWVSVKVVQNYNSKTWALWIDGTEKLTGLGFNNTGIDKLSSIHVEKGTMGTVFLDEISFSAN
jgi:hypothetical protein